MFCFRLLGYNSCVLYRCCYDIQKAAHLVNIVGHTYPLVRILLVATQISSTIRLIVSHTHILLYQSYCGPHRYPLVSDWWRTAIKALFLCLEFTCTCEIFVSWIFTPYPPFFYYWRQHWYPLVSVLLEATLISSSISLTVGNTDIL